MGKDHKDGYTKNKGRKKDRKEIGTCGKIREVNASKKVVGEKKMKREKKQSKDDGSVQHETLTAAYVVFSTDDILTVVNEACRVLDEGIAVKAVDLDISSVMGMGFSPYRGGIMFWADTLGSKYICSRLEEWSNRNGRFFKPCSYLAQQAVKKAPLSLSVDQAKACL